MKRWREIKPQEWYDGVDMRLALALTARRERVKKHAPGCLRCRSNQVQLKIWQEVPAYWKCRMCKHRFVYEPLVEQ